MNNDERKVLQISQRINAWANRKIYLSVANKHKRKWTVKRGEVYYVDLGHNIGSEENKTRPVVIIQANAYNFKSPVFICAIISNSPMTIPDIQVPIVNSYTYVDANGKQISLSGTIDLGQIKTIAKERIVSNHPVCTLTSEMSSVDIKLFNAFGLASAITSRDNTIKSLQGKVDYLQKIIDMSD